MTRKTQTSTTVESGVAPRRFDQRGRRRLRRATRPAAVAVAALAVFISLLTAGANPATAATPASDTVSASNPHCVYFGEVGDIYGPVWTLQCYGDLRTAVREATGGRVTNAPLNGADFTPQTAATINAAGNAAASAGGNSRMLLDIEFTGLNYQGRSLSISVPYLWANPIAASNPCRSQQLVVVTVVALPTGFIDNIESFRTFNRCVAQRYSQNDLRGDVHEWYKNDHLSQLPAKLNNKTRSLVFDTGPSRQELFDQCNVTTTSCTYIPKNHEVRFAGYKRIKESYNCSTTNTTQERVIWTHVTNGSRTMSTEVEVSASGGIKGLVEFETSVTQAYSTQWGWSDSFTDQTFIDIPPLSWGAIDRNPRVQTVNGTFDLSFKKPYYGRTNWILEDFRGTGPVPEDAGISRTPGGQMTSEQLAQHCSAAAVQARSADQRKEVVVID